MNTRYSTGIDLQRAATTPIKKALSVSGVFLISIVLFVSSAVLFLLNETRTDSYFIDYHTSDDALWCLLIAVVLAFIGFPKYSKFIRERNACINAMRGTYLVLTDEIVSGLPCVKSGNTYVMGQYFEITYSEISFVEALPVDPNTGDYATLRIGAGGKQYYFAIDGSQEAAHIIEKSSLNKLT